MKNFKKILVTITLTLGISTLPMQADAASYNVQRGDTFYSIANQYGLTLANLQIANNRLGNILYAGETITIPDAISYEDKKLMASLVHAEAVGEPYAGKVAVATVILNRVNHPEFPNTISEVINEKVEGHYAFTPVQNGTIHGGYTAEDMAAVDEALAFSGSGEGNGSIYFYNPETSTSDWIFSREVTVTIGNHRFAK